MININKMSPIILESQTKTDLDSNEQQIYINGQNGNNNSPINCPSQYILSEYDFKTLKLANVLIIVNLFGMVFILFGCTIIYMIVYSKWITQFIISLLFYIISDVLIILEKILFFHMLINKKQMIKICLCLNIISMMLKLIASIIISDISSCQLLVALILIFLSLPYNILIKLLTRRWKSIPDKLWRKQIIQVRKHSPQIYY